MAKNVQITLIDDLDGSEATETILFEFDGVRYEIDLSSGNAGLLRSEMAPYIEHARQVTRAKPSGRRPNQARSPAIRAWARERGYTVSERGRLPASITRIYAAHGSPGPDFGGDDE